MKATQNILKGKFGLSCVVNVGTDETADWFLCIISLILHILTLIVDQIRFSSSDKTLYTTQKTWGFQKCDDCRAWLYTHFTSLRTFLCEQRSSQQSCGWKKKKSI